MEYICKHEDMMTYMASLYDIGTNHHYETKSAQGVFITTYYHFAKPYMSSSADGVLRLLLHSPPLRVIGLMALLDAASISYYEGLADIIDVTAAFL